MDTLNLGIDGLDDIEQIGAGGSSRVYLATQVELDRRVALKVLTSSDNPDVARRFDRERKAMGRLSLNEGIVPVYSSGVTDQGEPYLIMPYYPNGSLQDRISEGPVPWVESVEYIASAAHTMAAAHSAGVVHLDLKPANILLSSTGSPRIADFGIAKLMSEQGATTNTGPAFTPTYSAPEILLGETPSPASDVYGLAASLWALIAGRAPFKTVDGEDNTLMAVVGRVIHQPPDDLRAFASDSICRVIEKGMAKDPGDRYPTAGALSQALAEAMDGARKPAPETSLLTVPAAGEVGVAGSAPAGTAGPANTDSLLNLAGNGRPGPGANGGGHHVVGGDGVVRNGNDQRSLRFDAPVPPRLVPAETNRIAGVADTLDRFSGVMVGIAVAAVLLLLIFVGPSLLGGTDNNTTTDATIQAVETEASISTSQLGALAGAGGSSGSASQPLDPNTSSTTEATTPSSRVTSARPTPTSATTSETTPTTPSTSETTATTPTTPSTSETTATSTSSSSSSSSSTSSTTTSTTLPATPLEPPADVAANFRGGRVVLTWSAPADAADLSGYTITRNGAVLGIQPGAGATRAVDDELPDITPGTTYDYAIKANGPAGEGRDSQYSPVVQVKIPNIGVVPADPTPPGG